MRLQHHFRPSSEGLLAWDVDRLVELTAGLEPVRIPLSEIKELDEPYWFGNGHAATVREIGVHVKLTNAADLDFPVIMCPEHLVMDGMHRVLKAEIEGHEFVDALILETLPEPDFIGMSPEELYDEEEEEE